MDWLQRARATRNVTNAIKADTYERRLTDEMLEFAPAFEKMRRQLSISHGHSRDLVQDTLLSLWQSSPQHHGAHEMAPTARVNLLVSQALSISPDYKRLRQWTVHDKYAATMAAISLGDVLEDILDSLREEALLAEKAEQARQEARQRADAFEQGIGSQEDLEAAVAAAEAAEAQVDAQALDSDTVMALATAVEEAAEEAGEQIALAESWGLDPGELRSMSFDERAAMMDRLSSDRLKKYADKIGRFRMWASAQQAKKARHGRDVVTSIELSNDLSRVLTSEYANLRHPVLRREFKRRMVSGQLLSRRMVGLEREGRGAIIALVDVSGTMSNKLGDADRDVWAKGCALALLDAAHRDGRAFVGSVFDAAVQGTWEFPPGQRPLDDVIDFVSKFSGGGTSFEKPLTHAVELLAVEHNATGKSRGDIVLITDGEASVTPQFIDYLADRKQRLGFRVFGIAVGMHEAPRSLAAVCDDIVHVLTFSHDPVQTVFTVL